jgi:hypothetical protein
MLVKELRSSDGADLTVMDDAADALLEIEGERDTLFDLLVALLAVNGDHMTSCDRVMGDTHPCTCGAEKARAELRKF